MPFVPSSWSSIRRLHRLDEYSAQQISGLLSFLRELQCTFDCALLVVHHTSKKRRGRPGQALRGSSDLHAFGDSDAYPSSVGLKQRRGEPLDYCEHAQIGGQVQIPNRRRPCGLFPVSFPLSRVWCQPKHNWRRNERWRQRRAVRHHAHGLRVG